MTFILPVPSEIVSCLGYFYPNTKLTQSSVCWGTDKKDFNRQMNGIDEKSIFLAYPNTV